MSIVIETAEAEFSLCGDYLMRKPKPGANDTTRGNLGKLFFWEIRKGEFVYELNDDEPGSIVNAGRAKRVRPE